MEISPKIVCNVIKAEKMACEMGNPAWLEIDLDALTHNVSVIRKNGPKGAIMCGVVKGDGYGHGSVAIASHLLNLNFERLAVATTDEGIFIRNALGEEFKHVPMHLLGPSHPVELKVCRKYNFIPTICTDIAADTWAELN